MRNFCEIKIPLGEMFMRAICIRAVALRATPRSPNKSNKYIDISIRLYELRTTYTSASQKPTKRLAHFLCTYISGGFLHPFNLTDRSKPLGYRVSEFRERIACKPPRPNAKSIPLKPHLSSPTFLRNLVKNSVYFSAETSII